MTDYNNNIVGIGCDFQNESDDNSRKLAIESLSGGENQRVSWMIDNMKDNKDSTVIRKDSIGYIPENVNLYPYLTGVENLDYFSKIAGLKFTTDQLYNFLLECGLNELDFNKPISEYSKGMRQKVGIAIAYAKRAKVYL